ncbi:hypothetical protein KGF56_004462 [Candida oxycetoniae]|uniref:Phosphatidic acid phosphatase type 2/haloperoxidase domain-containing protein n=1 Tax=Candida oxycetoniae TaxID=497107 RepID=A0AAI9SUA0_9ASCO|nr:uncharacterized protein KGF56_004462 [Candida oxycetoniae]KAI3402788.2 hypothetical protein KGF56_004462 [Candida oxycetoniae]
MLNLTISHPFATKQKVSGPQCFILASALPALVITIITFLKWSRSGKSRQEEQRFFHVLQVALLGLAVSISLTAIVTDILKNWIARPRPDFLARCGAPRDKFSSQFVNLGVCTAPYGMGELLDGLRSTPSGHSSISFASFLYLTLWLLAQFELTKSPPQHMYKHILVWLPLLFASYVSLSRVQDYRHHFTDVIFGTLIGCLFAWIVFHHYWEGLRSIDCSLPKTWNEPKENATILPI